MNLIVDVSEQNNAKACCLGLNSKDRKKFAFFVIMFVKGEWPCIQSQLAYDATNMDDGNVMVVRGECVNVLLPLIFIFTVIARRLQGAVIISLVLFHFYRRQLQTLSLFGCDRRTQMMSRGCLVAFVRNHEQFSSVVRPTNTRNQKLHL